MIAGGVDAVHPPSAAYNFNKLSGGKVILGAIRQGEGPCQAQTTYIDPSELPVAMKRRSREESSAASAAYASLSSASNAVAAISLATILSTTLPKRRPYLASTSRGESVEGVSARDSDVCCRRTVAGV